MSMGLFFSSQSISCRYFGGITFWEGGGRGWEPFYPLSYSSTCEAFSFKLKGVCEHHLSCKRHLMEEVKARERSRYIYIEVNRFFPDWLLRNKAYSKRKVRSTKRNASMFASMPMFSYCQNAICFLWFVFISSLKAASSDSKFPGFTKNYCCSILLYCVAGQYQIRFYFI